MMRLLRQSKSEALIDLKCFGDLEAAGIFLFRVPQIFACGDSERLCCSVDIVFPDAGVAFLPHDGRTYGKRQ